MRPVKKISLQGEGQNMPSRAIRKKIFAAVHNLNGGLKSKCILRAASEKSSGDKLVDTFVITG